MECPKCRSNGSHVYRRKTKSPEWRCRRCETMWGDPYIDGHVLPSVQRTLKGGCPKCGARGYNKDIWFKKTGQWSFQDRTYPEENFKGCFVCDHEWAISDYEDRTNYLSLIYLPLRSGVGQPHHEMSRFPITHCDICERSLRDCNGHE